MPFPIGAAPPYARDNPPWGDCGDPASPEFGAVFCWPGRGAAVTLTYDRHGRRHAVTLFAGVGEVLEIVLQGRRFSIAPTPSIGLSA
jgi:hypothetical protein